jgi:ribosome-binding factor A
MTNKHSRPDHSEHSEHSDHADHSDHSESVDHPESVDTSERCGAPDTPTQTDDAEPAGVDLGSHAAYLAYAARLRAGDDPAADPAAMFGGPPAGALHHRDAQLCRQASEALSIALAASADPVLRDVTIASVEPAAGTARLMVTVYPTERDPDFLVARLERARGYLRGEVAAAIHRKRVPDLAFQVSLDFDDFDDFDAAYDDEKFTNNSNGLEVDPDSEVPS